MHFFISKKKSESTIPQRFDFTFSQFEIYPSKKTLIQKLS